MSEAIAKTERNLDFCSTLAELVLALPLTHENDFSTDGPLFILRNYTPHIQVDDREMLGELVLGSTSESLRKVGIL